MIIGNGAPWVEAFRGHDARLIERICEIFPLCLKALGENPKEDDITINLVDRFQFDRVVRRLFHHWEYQFEPTGVDANGASYSKGKIDLAMFWDQDRKRYLAYEAKRLNVTTSSGVASLALPYVKEGVIRYVTEQYSEGLPVGCMLGFVLNGDTKAVSEKIGQALSSNSEELGLLNKPKKLAGIGKACRFETLHKRSSGTEIFIRHSLVVGRS